MIFLSHGKERANIIKALIATMLQRYIYFRYLYVQHWTLAIVGTHNNRSPLMSVEKCHSPVHPPKRQWVTKFSQFFFYKTYVSNRHLFWTNIGRGSLLSPNIKIYNLICCPCTFQSYGWSGDKNLSNCVKEFNLFPPSLPHCFLTLWH